MVLPERPQSLKQLPRLAFASGSIASIVDRGLQTLPLSSAQRHYLERVRRLRTGDRFLAFDSSGRLWQATLADTGINTGADVDAVIETELVPVERELPFRLELAISIPKGSGFDTLVRQLTELGVSTIVPLTSERTVSVPNTKKLQRWRAIATEAAEQCERVVVPTIADPSTWHNWLKNSKPHPTGTVRYIASARNHRPHLLTCLNHLDNLTTLAVAVGPEGGWTDTELKQAQDAGVLPIGLGQRILRTVTAPLAISSLVAGYGDCQGTSQCDDTCI